MDENQTQHLRVSNDYSEPITLCLEPWADQILIPSKSSFEIVAKGPDGDHLEVIYEERRVSVYGWSGSTLSVLSRWGKADRVRHCSSADASPQRSLNLLANFVTPDLSEKVLESGCFFWQCRYRCARMSALLVERGGQAGPYWPQYLLATSNLGNND